jgi:hypothetical protein
MSNPFAHKMELLSDSELLKVLELKDDYQPLAVEAAEAELEKRNLTSEQRDNAKAILDLEKEKAKGKKEKADQIRNKYYEVLDFINPISPKNLDTKIKIIAVGLAIPFLMVIYEYRFLFEAITHGELGPFVLISIIIFAIIGLGIIRFWKIHKSGWMVLSFNLTFTLLGLIFNAITEIRWTYEIDYESGLSGLLAEQLYPRMGITYYVIRIGIIGGILTYISTKKIRERFQITQRLKQIAILLPVIVFGLYVLFLKYNGALL